MALMNPYNYKKPQNAVNFKMNVAKDQKENAEFKEEVVTNISQGSNKPMTNADKYLEQKILTSKPEELVSMLYDGIIKFCNLAKIAVENKSYIKVNENSLKAQAIVSELQATLNMDYEISAQLNSLYDFMYRTLIDANLKRDDKSFSDVIEVAILLKKTWNEAMSIS